MSDPVKQIASFEQFSATLSSTPVIIGYFHGGETTSDNDVSVKFHALAKDLARPNKVAFVKGNVAKNPAITNALGPNAIPSLVCFRDGSMKDSVSQPSAEELDQRVRAMIYGFGSGSFDRSFGSPAEWYGAQPPANYENLTSVVEAKNIQVLNNDPNFDAGRELVNMKAPSSLGDKGNRSSDKTKDWVESDTDAQLMIFIPFVSLPKLESLQITSFPDADAKLPTIRPRTLKLYKQQPSILDFAEADETTPTQEIEIPPEAWDEKTGTAHVRLNFVSFQQIASLTVYVVDGDGDTDRTRIDRIRLFGAGGNMQKMGTLEKEHEH